MNRLGKLANERISSRNCSSSCLMRDSAVSVVRIASGMPREDRVACGGRQRRVDAAGHDPRRVDALAGHQLDGLLAELAQTDAAPREVRVGGEHADEVARRRVAVHAEQQVRRRQVEEAERVRLHDLREVQDAAQVGRGLRDPHRENRVARLRRRDQVADRADAAGARHQRRHLVERPALAQLLEAAELRDVELRVRHAPLVVQLDRDSSSGPRCGSRGRW